MKRLISIIITCLILILLCALVSCDSTHPDPVKRSEDVHTSSIGRIQYVEFDGHEYVLWQGNIYAASLCHSPKCKCLNKN